MRWRILEKLEDLSREPEYVTQGLIHDINEQVIAQMKVLGLRNKDFAERLGVSRAYINKLLDGNPNLTARSLARIATALDCDLSVNFRPRGVIRGWRTKAPAVEQKFEVSLPHLLIFDPRCTGRTGKQV